MLNYTLLPLAEFFAFLSLDLLKKLWDQSFKSLNAFPESSKKTTIYSYVVLYSGPEFVRHYRYSMLLSIQASALYLTGTAYSSMLRVMAVCSMYVTYKMACAWHYKKNRHYSFEREQRFIKYLIFLLGLMPYFYTHYFLVDHPRIN